MIKLNARFVIILTAITFIIWIGYESYSTLSASTTEEVTVRQELLRELTADENEAVIDDLEKRLAY